MSRKIIVSDEAPAAVGPYSQAIVTTCQQLVFTAGQIPLDPVTGKLISGNIRVQTKRALDNLKAVLEAAGSALENVLKVTVFLSDMDDFAAMNEVYAEYFGENPPARSAVEVSRLPKGAKVEIECVAAVRNSEK